ncbi:MAG: hypothetical protein RIQ60_552 [Pseudomonadota bacterium]|jgi:hypothetical protein
MQDNTIPPACRKMTLELTGFVAPDLHNPVMSCRRHAHALTRLLMAWLIMCIGLLGVLPVLAAATAPMGAQAMDEMCSVSMGLSGADAGGSGTGSPATLADHGHCALCVVANLAPPVNLVSAVLPAPAARHEPAAVQAQIGAEPASPGQARGPPARSSSGR